MILFRIEALHIQISFTVHTVPNTGYIITEIYQLRRHWICNCETRRGLSVDVTFMTWLTNVFGCKSNLNNGRIISNILGRFLQYQLILQIYNYKMSSIYMSQFQNHKIHIYILIQCIKLLHFRPNSVQFVPSGDVKNKISGASTYINYEDRP